ncbi:MAG TPA: oligosaccharide flippase family protein [Thermoanaerobaculia bacterium]|nr:oligosaccharide flippase family protein [Thermoanaerobaculia bacterium]
MTRTGRFVSGVALGYTYQALVAIVSLWITPFLLRNVGTSDYGLWLVASQIIAYLLLLDFGLLALVPREIAYNDSETADASNLSRYVSDIWRLLLWQTPVVGLVCVGGWLLLPEEWARLEGPLIPVLVGFVILFPARIFQSVLQGLQDLAYVGKIQIAVWSLSIVTTVLLVLAGYGLYGLSIGWLVGQMVIGPACYVRIRSRFPRVLDRSPERPAWSRTKDHLRRGFWVHINQIGQILLSGTDILIIGWLFGPAAVVPYAITGKLVVLLGQQPGLLVQTAGPALSQLRGTGDRKRIGDVCGALALGVIVLSGAVFCVVAAVNEPFVSAWVGSEQYGGTLLTMLLLTTMLVRHWNVTVAYSVFAFGHERRLAITGISDGLVTFVSAITLIWMMGPIGAPIGSLIGVLAISLPANLRALSRETAVPVRVSFKHLYGWMWRFVPLAGISALIPIAVPEATLWQIALIACVVGTGYGSFMLPVALRSSLSAYLDRYLGLVWRRRRSAAPSDDHPQNRT